MQGQLTQPSAAGNRQLVMQLLGEDTAVALTDDVILQDLAQATTIVGRDAVVDFIQAFFRHAFTDLAMEVNTLLADKETATLSLSIAGRQMAPFWGLPCSGRQVSLSLVLICRFRADRIARIELYYDGGTLLRQLGLGL